MDLSDLPTHLPNTSKPPTSTHQNDPTAPPDLNIPICPAKNASPQTKPPKSPSEDEESTLSPICIPGTSITLQSEEDIQQWIADRKKHWPSRKNLALKQSSLSEKRKHPDSHTQETPAKKLKNLCRFFHQHGTCRYGTKCKNVHEDSDYKVINNLKVKVPKPFENSYRPGPRLGPHGPSAGPHGPGSGTSAAQPSLYKMLVKKDQLELENEEVVEFLYYMERRGVIRHDYGTA